MHSHTETQLCNALQHNTHHYTQITTPITQSPYTGDLSVGAPPAAPIAGAAALGGVVGASAAASPRSPVGAGVAGLSVICNAEQGKGLVIGARVTRQAAQVCCVMVGGWV